MQENENTGTTIHLLDYLEVILRRKSIVMKMTCAAFVTAVIISLLMPKIYTSTARMLPPQQDQGLMSLMMGQLGGIASIAGDIVGKGTVADLYVEILKSEEIKDRIIDRFNLFQLYEKKYRADLYPVMDKKIKIEAGRKDGIISISVDDKDPKRSADIANAYIEELGKLTVGLDMTGAQNNGVFLVDRLARAKADLAAAEDSLKQFQSKNKAVSVEEQSKASIVGIAQLRAQLAFQEVQLATLRSQFTDSSQEIKTLKATIANMHSQLAQLEGNTPGSVIPSVGSVPELGQQYIRLMREFKIQETIVEMLTKQYELSKFSAAKNVSSIQVIQKARVPDKKSKPKRIRNVLSATAVTFVIAIIIAFLLEHVTNMPEDQKNRWRCLANHLPALNSKGRRNA